MLTYNGLCTSTSSKALLLFPPFFRLIRLHSGRCTCPVMNQWNCFVFGKDGFSISTNRDCGEDRLRPLLDGGVCDQRVVWVRHCKQKGVALGVGMTKQSHPERRQRPQQRIQPAIHIQKGREPYLCVPLTAAASGFSSAPRLTNLNYNGLATPTSPKA